ncbi:hypothetical protein BJY54_005855 [Streptomyces nodosus]|uniref:VanZ family protein n=2 Tax=Streptomyces nodosus TaxID=40318 RepID=A0A0B5DJ86_9ACTN|nr:VanZ family protein [Streptomyces nodosus]AJE43728.1 hypothetical protein SNOD_29745 [Streptomyces nodosus]MBB4795243.1 hypothetical protein [Streptomyces nodosus]QEV42236.1 VanZ family protein [Streptomyces nodosus]
MFTAIFQDRYGYLAVCSLTALVLGGASWLYSRRLGNPYGVWWGGLAATLTGVLGVTFMGGGPARGECVVNHDLTEPFHTTQGLWNLAMTVPLGLFGLLAVRRLLPALVGVVTLPLAIEFTQATVDGLGRTCDSADVEMNILGGLVGLAVAAVALGAGGKLEVRAGARASLIASAAVLALGVGVVRPMLTFTEAYGTELVPADSQQRHAVEQAVREAFGDLYQPDGVYRQPCWEVPCTHIIFQLVGRDKGQPEAFGSGSLSWPDRKQLTMQLEDGDRPGVTGYPVTGSTAASTEQEAYRIARSYMREHYPWAEDADRHRTSPVGEKAEQGWTTSWFWLHDEVQMPRTLDVRVGRSGHVSQVDVALGPTRVTVAEAKLTAPQAEDRVRKVLLARSRAFGDTELDLSGVRAMYQVEASTLKAVEREGTWRSEWLVTVSTRPEDTPGQDETVPSEPSLWWVDSGDGRLHEGIAPVEID